MRSTTTRDDGTTRFGAVPLGDSQMESLVSVRHSRMALEGSMAAGAGTLSGYVEADFSNSPPQQPYRFRQYFGRYTIGNWEFSAGQEWSLLRPNRQGISTTNGLMNTRAVDAGYHVGLLGYRNRQVRVVRRLGGWTAGLSYESGRFWVPALAHDSRRLHYEFKGVASRNQYGGAVAAVLHATRRIDLVGQQSWIRGGGKDALNTAPPGVTVAATLAGVEANPGRGFQIYAYAGTVCAGRSAGNRAVTEWSGGFWKQLHQDRWGIVTAGVQVGRVDRLTWSGREGGQTFAMFSLRRTFGPAR